MRGLAAVIGSVLVAVTGAGCGGGGGGGKGGQGGGLSGLGGFGLVDGGPTDGGGGTDGGADVPLTPAPPICGNGIVETGEACDGAARAACAAGQRCSATCTCVAGPPAPTDSGALIAQALAAGRIDYFTSLLYRAYRLAGDRRLPPAYDGDFTVGEDTALFLEVSRLWGTLTPAQQQQLNPYIVRPNDPASVYSTTPAAPAFFDGQDDAGDDLLAAGEPTELRCPANAQTGETDWRTTETTHFVVWSCGTGTADPHAGKRQVAAAIAEQVWTAEVPSMGPPRGDDYPVGPGDKSRIDVYLLPLNKCVRNDGTLCAALTSTSMLAAAALDTPCDGSRGPLTSSGYAILRLDLIPEPDAPDAARAISKARSDFAHEFFHLLTYGLNLDALGGRCSGGQSPVFVLGRTSWLMEASATWAEWAYMPDDNPVYREGKFSDFQGRNSASASLLDNTPALADNPAYGAYTYPLFLSQEAGGRMPFEDFWKTARAPRTREALDDALNTRFSFARHFRDFAVKMFNLTLPGDPIAPLLHTFDSAVPVDILPSLLPDVSLPEENTDLPFKIVLAPLAAQYQTFYVPRMTRWVDVDLSGAGADLTMDAIVNVGGRFTRRSIDGLRFTFCRDEPADDIQDFYLVIANVAHREDAKAEEDYKVKTRTACPATLTGWIRSESSVEKHYINVDDTVDQFEQTRETWSLGMEHDMDTTTPFPTIDAHWHAVFAHHESVVRASCQYTTVDGESGGSAVTPLAIMEPGNGQLILAPFSPDPGHFDVEMVTHYEMCDGNNLTTNSMRTVYEQLATVSGYVQLTPLPQNPDRYIGSKVITHSEQPLYMGTSVVDWKISWDITRNRR